MPRPVLIFGNLVVGLSGISKRMAASFVCLTEGLPSGALGEPRAGRGVFGFLGAVPGRLRSLHEPEAGCPKGRLAFRS